jgi:ribonuclease HI
MSSSEFPVNKELDVVDGRTISKDNGWWKAVVVCDGYYGKEINVYLWKKEDNGWKRKQKCNFKDEESWNEVKDSIDDFFGEYFD